MPNDELRVFISWSGETSKSIAISLRDLLPVIFDNVRPWVSDRDIGAGGRGLQKIASELEDTAFGIIVVTRENQESAWINFEAGALSKRFGSDESRVVPLLVDMDAIAELEGPLSQFQAKLLDRSGVEDLLAALGEPLGVSEDVIKRRLATEWEPFTARVASARSKERHPSTQPKRSLESMVEETLELVRAVAQQAEPPEWATSSKSKNMLERRRIAQIEALDLPGLFVKHGVSDWTARWEDDTLAIRFNDPFAEIRLGETIRDDVAQRLRTSGVKLPFRIFMNSEQVVPF